ncbi:MAG: hypothetical protein FJ096_17610 [Deltaproteobacteria bacterium]|nr:hypothetical protein [Deltaproteobacteria bacterium]
MPPLDVKGSEIVVTCRYCKAQTQRRGMRTLAPETPHDFQPPPRWRPPPHMPAPSDVEYAYRGSRGTLQVVFFAVLPVILLIGFAGYQTWKTLRGDPLGKPLEKLLEVDLRGKPGEVAARLGVNDHGKVVYVDVSAAAPSAVFFSWKTEDSAAPSAVGFSARKEARLPSGTCGRLAATLGKPHSESWSFSRRRALQLQRGQWAAHRLARRRPGAAHRRARGGVRPASTAGHRGRAWPHEQCEDGLAEEGPRHQLLLG